MSEGGRAIDVDELQRAVAAVEPAALLVPPRLLRRVIRRDRELRFFGGAAARQTAYAIAGASLARFVAPEELGRTGTAEWPETVFLIEQPERSTAAGAPAETEMTVAWRRLFRARVRHAVRRAIQSGSLDAVAIARRVAAIGYTEFEEAWAVLKQDGFVFADDAEPEVYAAFAARFLELTWFAPASRGSTFPAIEDPAAVEAMLAADVDAPALFAATRTPGAADPCPSGPIGCEGTEVEDAATEGPFQPVDGAWRRHDEGSRERTRRGSAGRRQSRFRRLGLRARSVAATGNDVRAAVLWARAARGLGGEAGESARAAARADLKHLADRLQKALFVRKGEAELWAEALTPLVWRAAVGFWSPEAKLLYDLQKVCLDHEREVYRLEPVAWLRSLGRRPLKRALPHLREVAMSTHLRAAAGRLTQVRLTRDERGRLEGLLRAAVHRAGLDLRERFRPRLEAALVPTWVEPRGAVERVAFRKLVEELLDQVVTRGFTTLGDLRDSASQSDLKLPDLAGPREFLRGGRLLAADRALAEALDGVHRPGEVYLRWFQRFSAAAFGTKAGRFLTRYVALPYGGAYVALKGLEEVVLFATKGLEALGKVAPTHVTEVHLNTVNEWSILLLGTVALGSINFPRFRAVFLGALAGIGRQLRGLFVDPPAWVLRHPHLLRVLRSAPVRTTWRLVVKPGALAAAVWGVGRAVGLGSRSAEGLGVVSFLTANVVFNTEVGRALEEDAVEAVNRSLRSLAFDVVPGLVRLTLAAFEDALGRVERVIYAVDEWLRFRGGQSRASLAAKAALGAAWAVAAYTIRIYVNLLIEPQVNPIKHFPVVTVSHKVMLPLVPKLTLLLAAGLTPLLGRDLGLLVAAANVLLLPGVFGFLVWELRSNWRLYEANRPEGLPAVSVGGHGETVVGLLRPGFHSGTLPKQFARLRRARREGRVGAALKRREALHHVEEAVRRFVERDVAALLEECRAPGVAGVRPGSIRLATNRIRVDLISEDPDAPPLTVDLEERPGGLVAGVSQPGWLEDLNDEGRCALNAALIGLFKQSGARQARPPGLPVAVAAGVGLVLDRVEVGWRTWADGWDAEAGGAPGPVPFEALPDVTRAAGESRAPRAEETSAPG